MVKSGDGEDNVVFTSMPQGKPQGTIWKSSMCSSGRRYPPTSEASQYEQEFLQPL
jgi:hypothetical protein